MSARGAARARRSRRRGGGSRGALSDLGVVPPVVTGALTRRVLGLPAWAWAGLAVGGGLTAWAVLAVAKRAAVTLTPSQQAAFKSALPAYAQPYAEVILRVAEEQGVDPFTLFALGDRESLWGTSSAYKQQTGDWAARMRPAAKAADARVYRIIDAKPDASGNVKVMPADGLGWGRGLMQIDWEMQFPWVSTHDWRDAYANVSYGATYLTQLLKLFAGTGAIGTIASGGKVTVSPTYAGWMKKSPGTYKDPRPLTGRDLQAAAIAAYNTGPGNVIRNLALGLTAEASTTGGDYTADALNRQANLLARYTAAGGGAPTTAVV